MAVCAGGAVMLWHATAATIAAVGVAQRVPYGASIPESSLIQIEVHPDPGVSPVPWSRRGDLVGHQAATDLLPGSVLTPDAVAAVSIPAPGRALVGIHVKPGQLPATALQPRDNVLLVTTDASAPASGSSDSAASGWSIGGTVITVGSPDPDGALTVDVEIAAPDAAAVAAQSGADHLAIVLQARG
jgi:hypothetical protein